MNDFFFFLMINQSKDSPEPPNESEIKNQPAKVGNFKIMILNIHLKVRFILYFLNYNLINFIFPGINTLKQIPS